MGHPIARVAMERSAFWHLAGDSELLAMLKWRSDATPKACRKASTAFASETSGHSKITTSSKKIERRHRMP